MVDIKEFVLVWEKSSSVGEVAKHFGIARDTASVKASNLRKKGVKLKVMSSAFQPIDVQGLNELIGKTSHE